jgi:hypothetical protein
MWLPPCLPAQIREKELEGGAFLTEARAALKVCRAAGVPLVINDRVDIALALGPDVGVHVGQGDIPCAEVGGWPAVRVAGQCVTAAAMLLDGVMCAVGSGREAC